MDNAVAFAFRNIYKVEEQYREMRAHVGYTDRYPLNGFRYYSTYTVYRWEE